MGEIEFETVTLQVPKRIMDFLRRYDDETPEQYLERSIVHAVLADLDANAFVETPKQLATEAGLNEVFRKLINDEVS